MGRMPLHGRPSAIVGFETRDRQDAKELLGRAHGTDVEVDFHGNPDAFFMNFTAVHLGATKLVHVRMSSWRFTRHLESSCIVIIPIKGFVSCAASTRTFDGPSPESGIVGRPGEDVTIKVSRGAGLALYVPVEDLAMRAERLAGMEVPSSCFADLATTIDFKNPDFAPIARTMRAAMAEMCALDASGMGEFAAAGFDDTLLNLSCLSLFPALARKLLRRQPDSGPAAIRKARDYIRAHAGEQVDLLNLAGEIGLSMRAMQENFKKYIGVSPRDYLMESRLELARERLMLTDHISSVTEIAFASGFSDPGHFAARYRDKYGELPSETRKKARR